MYWSTHLSFTIHGTESHDPWLKNFKVRVSRKTCLAPCSNNPPSLPNQRYHQFYFTVTSQNVTSASASWMAHYPFHPGSTLGSQHRWPALSLVICPDLSCLQTLSHHDWPTCWDTICCALLVLMDSDLLAVTFMSVAIVFFPDKEPADLLGQSLNS